jgi:hypothetical protein
VIRVYANALPALRASEQLSAIEAASVPYMDKDGHRDTMRRHLSLVGGDVKAAPASEAELAAIGIKVEHVEKKGVD